jgi:chromosome transmission fidelity protein 18
MKEADINYLAVLDNLFSPLSKKRVKELGMTDEEEGKYVSRLSREIEGSGKESNIASGKQPIPRGSIIQ